jgi:hypothetical protein
MPCLRNRFRLDAIIARSHLSGSYQEVVEIKKASWQATKAKHQ